MKTDVYAPGVPSAVSGSGSGFEPADALAPKTSSPARPRAPSLIANLPVRAPARTRSQSADSAFVRRASLPAEPQSGDAAALRCASLPNLSHSADSAPLRGVSLPDWPQSGSQRSGAAAGQPSAMQPGDHSPAPDTEAHPPSNRQALWNKARPYVTPAAEGLASSLSLASALTSGHVSRITGAMSGLSWVGAATAATATSTATTTPEKIANHALAVATAIAGATSTAASLLQGDNAGAIPSGIVSSTAWGANAAGSMALHAGKLAAGQGHAGANAAHLAGAALNLGGALAGGVASHLTSVGAPALPAQATSAGLWLAGSGLQSLGNYLQPKP